MKPKWKPKYQEAYWYVSMFGIIQDTWHDREADKRTYKLGLVFKTKREAQARYKEIVKFLKTGEILVKY